jgi:dehydro coenzyme F420 reductase / coenzyme F420-0:L-glutamate ligase / coenzyme F420-1:gamma-L-glutamate ligase
VTAPADAGVVQIIPVTGIGEVRPGDDLGAVLAQQMPWLADGDVVVVTSKIVSKAEGRLVAVGGDDPIAREALRQKVIDDETVRVVARRGELRIVVNRQGVVMAGAGVDASNVTRNEIALLPTDPDGSAASLRTELGRRLGVDVGVVISDSLGRPWRAGIIDQALGSAGVVALRDLRGIIDGYGNVLNATLVAIADEIASAADLAKGKLGGIPVAVVRGVDPSLLAPIPDPGARPLVRTGAEDMFRLGTDEAVALGRADAAGFGQPAGRLHDDARAVIAALAPADAGANAVREAYLGYLLGRPDAMWRSCVSGHLTASTVVIDPSRDAVLLTLHPRLGKWVQVGGHCEPEDATLLAAARREATEESGIAALRMDPVPIHLDVHALTCSLGVPTRHFDVRFLAVTPPGAEPVISSESLDLRWFGWDDLPAGTEDLRPLLAAARARLASGLTVR